MIEVRIHGRGGQGGVIASQILASAIYKEGNYAQSFPEFGVERRGAPVAAFVRMDKSPLLLRSKIYEPDMVVVLDSALMDFVDVTSGLKAEGKILINSDLTNEDFNFSSHYKIGCVDASSIALKHGLGSATAPIINTAILGAFSKVTGLVSLDALLETIRKSVPVKVEANLAACREAYQKSLPRFLEALQKLGET